VKQSPSFAYEAFANGRRVEERPHGSDGIILYDIPRGGRNDLGVGGENEVVHDAYVVAL
jgi:hypothetical protein